MDASNFVHYECDRAVTGVVRGSRSTAPSSAISGGSVAAERSYRTSGTLTPVFHLYFPELSCDQVSMKTKRVILARFVDFEVTPTNVLPWQPCVRFKKKISFC